MSYARFKGEIANDTESLYNKFKQNSNIKRDNSRDRSPGISDLKYSMSNNDLLKKSYLSSKSKIDYTSEDILKQLNSNNNYKNSNNNNNNKSLSYTNLVKSTFSDFQKSLPNNNIDFYEPRNNGNKNENYNFPHKFIDNENAKGNLKLSANSLLKNTESFNNFMKERNWSNNSLFDKSTEKILDKFYEYGNNKTTNFELSDNYNNNKNKPENNFNKLLEKLDFYKLKEKKNSDLNAHKQSSLYNYNFNEKATDNETNNIRKSIEFNSNDSKNKLSSLNNNNHQDMLAKKSEFLKLKNEKKNGLHNKNNSSTYTKNQQESTEEYHTFSKPPKHEDSSLKAAANKSELTSTIKKSPYSNYNYTSKDSKNYKNNNNINHKLDQERDNMQIELRQKNEEIRLLKSNFKKKIELIEDENTQNVQKMELHFKHLMQGLEDTLYTSQIQEEGKERSRGKFIQEILAKLKSEYIDLKSNSINLSKHEQLIRELKNQLSQKNDEANSLYGGKIKEIIEFFDKPEYVNLVENMRFYLKHKDKLDFAHVDFEHKANLESIREFDIWLDKIKLNLVSAETDYLNGMIALENKYNEFYFDSVYERNEKLDYLENEINTKFSNLENFSYVFDNLFPNENENNYQSNFNYNFLNSQFEKEEREENRRLHKNSSIFNYQTLSKDKAFEENNEQNKIFKNSSLGNLSSKFQSLENLLNFKKDVRSIKENNYAYSSSKKNDLHNGYGSTAINTLDYLKKKISEENFLTASQNKEYRNNKFTEKAKNFMRDLSNSELIEGAQSFALEKTVNNKNLHRLESLRKEFNLRKDENLTKTQIESKLSTIKANLLNKSGNSELENILTKYKKTKIFLKNASNEAEKSPIDLNFFDKSSKNDSNLNKEFVFISNRKNEGRKTNEINTSPVKEPCDSDNSELDCEEGNAKEIKSIPNYKSIVNL